MMNSIVTNEDCMALMARYPDKYFDLAVVDPPYGYGGVTVTGLERVKGFGGYIDKYKIEAAVLDSNQRSLTKVEVVHAQVSKETIRSFSEVNVSPPPEYFNELFRVSKHQIIWGGNYFILPPSRGFIIWKKPISENFSMAMCEYAWMSYNTNAKAWEGVAQGTKKDPRVHPTQKPVALYDWIFQNYAKEGDKILDTHLGSGSSRIAAHKNKLDFTACELDAEYFEAQERRFEAFVSQTTLF